MKVLAEAIEDYLALRRGLGFKLKSHSRCLKEFRIVSRARGRASDHDQAGFAMGDATTACTAGGMGRPVKRGAGVRTLLERYGPDDRNPTGGPPAESPQPCQALPLFR